MRGVECVEVFSNTHHKNVIFYFFCVSLLYIREISQMGVFDFQDDFHVFPLVTWERENIGDQISTAASQKCTDSNIYLLPL